MVDRIAELIHCVVISVHRVAVVIDAVHAGLPDEIQMPKVSILFQQEETPLLDTVLGVLNAHLDALTVSRDVMAVVVGPGGLDAKRTLLQLESRASQ